MAELYTENVEAIAREHFFSPGAFNEGKYAKDFALFLILRKQTTRYLRAGQMNWMLALNNLIVLRNSFGHTATVKIIAEMYNAPQVDIVNHMFAHLGLVGWVPDSHEVRADITASCPRYTLET